MTNPMWTVLIIKMFMFARGFREPLFHPTKGGTRHNILKWTGLGFTFKVSNKVNVIGGRVPINCA
jgi:hypothetical protein